MLPTANIVAVGLIERVEARIPAHFCDPKDQIFLIGQTSQEFGQSEYLNYCHHMSFDRCPDIDFDLEKRHSDFVRSLVEQGLLKSARSLSIGGLAVSLAESCVDRPRALGAELHVEKLSGEGELRKDAVMFAESGGRFLISFDAKNAEEIRALAKLAQVPISGQGQVGGKKVSLKGAVDVAIPASTANRIWSRGLDHMFHVVRRD